ncbi:MAG: hypothetical protein MRJ96_04675 [Nitrospirales bacterium]|nr:hypothetical protein [Nitrospira sp.]MDR4500735.1 hypothetical protein [Nitrospirales bacterium]
MDDHITRETRYRTIILSLVLVLFSSTTTLHGQPQLSVEVLEPALDGHEVGAQMKIKGTAHLPKGNYLWIFVHRIKGFEDKWWPQGMVRINSENSTWAKTIRFGEKIDVGYQFEIAIVTVNKAEHEKLRLYEFRSKKTGVWDPIAIPPTTSPTTYRIVKKISS